MPIHKSVNKKFFKKWSREMAYVTGFFLADGNMVKTKRDTHFISFYSADKYLIGLVRSLLKANHKISSKEYESGICYRLQIGSKEMFEDLLVLNITPNKSRRFKMPEVPNKFFGDMVRGYFDGDGNVWAGLVNKARRTPTKCISAVFTSANHSFLVFLLKKLRQKGIRGGGVYKSKNGEFSRLSFSTLDTLKLYEIMYNLPSRLCLKRKKLVFERFIKMRV